MKITVRGTLRDNLAFIRHLKRRDRIFRKTPANTMNQGPMNLLAEQLHPRRQVLRIVDIRRETPTSKTYQLEPADGRHAPADSLREPADGRHAPAGDPQAPPSDPKRPAFFRAGQYIAVEDMVEGVPVSRPYSISSTPDEAADNGFYEITIKAGEDGFFAPWALREWKTGRILHCSAPAGTFYFEPLRDAVDIVCIAGGSGITPFKSILTDTLRYYPDPRFTLIYGVDGVPEIMFRKELEELRATYPDRLSVVTVFSGPGRNADAFPDVDWETEEGFITAGLIRKYIAGLDDVSYFICGPPAMYSFLDGELREFSLKPGRLRKENYGRSLAGPGGGRNYTITVLKSRAGVKTEISEPMLISADETETVLTALERAGLNPPSLCRSGECAWCRSRLVEGDIFIPPENDGRRQADKKFGWFHPCSSYPRSDLVIEVPENPMQWR